MVSESSTVRIAPLSTSTYHRLGFLWPTDTENRGARLSQVSAMLIMLAHVLRGHM